MIRRHVTLGLISDTHDCLDPAVARHFAGVDRILHAGDVCRPEIIAELESIAPVTVAQGNCDPFPGWRPTEVVEVDGCRILVEHVVRPDQPSQEFRSRLARVRPRIVVFGHSHRPFNAEIDGVLYLNPGSAGAPRFGLPRSIGLLHIDGTGARLELIQLDGRAPSRRSGGESEK